MKKLGLSAAILLTFVIVSFGQTAEELKKASEFYNQGVEFYKKDQFDKAIESYTAYLKIHPNVANIRYNRGLAYYFKGIDLAKNTGETSRKNLNLAIADFSEAIKFDSNSADAWIYRGKSYFWLQLDGVKFLDLAISDFSQALKLNPNSADSYYERAKAYQERNQLQNALADFKKAIELNPKDGYAYFERGKVYYSQHNYTAASSDFATAYKILPDHPYSKTWLDNANQKLNPTQISTGATPQNSASQDWKSAFEAGKNALRQNQPDSAIIAFQKAINLLPTKFESDQIELLFAIQKGLIQENLAKAQIAKKEYDGAIKTCSAAQEFLYKTLVNKISKIEKFKFDSSMLIEISKSKLDLTIVNYDLVLSQAGESVEIGKRCFDAFPQNGLSMEQQMSLIGVGMLKIGTAELVADSFFTTSSVRLSLSQICQGKGRNICGEGSRTNEINKYAEKSLADINKAIGFAPTMKNFYLQRAAVYRQLGKNDLALADETKAGQLK